MEPTSLRPPALTSGFFTPGAPGKPMVLSAAAAAKSLQSCPTLCDQVLKRMNSCIYTGKEISPRGVVKRKCKMLSSG